MDEYTPTPIPESLTGAYWPAHNRVEADLVAAGVDIHDAEAEAFFAGLRAVEAAVRADQIEKDAGIASDLFDDDGGSNPSDGPVAAAILAQPKSEEKNE